MDGVAAVIARRDRLITAVAVSFSSGPGGEAAVGRAADTLVAGLPPGVRHSAVYRSLTPFAGAPPDAKTVRDLCWAMAGDVAALRADRPVWPPALPPEPATVVLQVVATKSLPRRPGADGRVRVRLRVVSGPGTPTTVETSWSLKFLRYAALAVLGFARPTRDNRPPVGPRYQHHRQLVGCRFKARVRTQDGRTELDELACPAACMTWNRGLGDVRARKTFACPFAFTHPCHECPKGQSSCLAACRPLDLIEVACPGCRTPATVDPAWGGLCRNCDNPGRKKEPTS